MITISPTEPSFCISGFTDFWIARKAEICNSCRAGADEWGRSPNRSGWHGGQRGRRTDREWRRHQVAELQSRHRVQEAIQRVRSRSGYEHDRPSQGGFRAFEEESTEMTVVFRQKRRQPFKAGLSLCLLP